MIADFTLSPSKILPRFRDSIGIRSGFVDRAAKPPNVAAIEELRELHLQFTPPPVARKLLLATNAHKADLHPVILSNQAGVAELKDHAEQKSDTANPVFQSTDLDKILACIESVELHIKFVAANALLDLVTVHKQIILLKFRNVVIRKAVGLHTDPEPFIRNITLQILSLLAEAGVSEIIQLALVDLQNEKNPSFLREQAARAISVLCIKGDLQAVSALSNIITRDSVAEKGVSLRVECLLALSKVCTPGCQRALATVKDALKDR